MDIIFKGRKLTLDGFPSVLCSSLSIIPLWQLANGEWVHGVEQLSTLLYKRVFSAVVHVTTVHMAAASVLWWKHCMTWFSISGAAPQ